MYAPFSRFSVECVRSLQSQCGEWSFVLRAIKRSNPLEKWYIYVAITGNVWIATLISFTRKTKTPLHSTFCILHSYTLHTPLSTLQAESLLNTPLSTFHTAGWKPAKHSTLNTPNLFNFIPIFINIEFSTI